MDIDKNCTKITYFRRFKHGDFEGEEISIELSFSIEDPCPSLKEAINYAADEVLKNSRWYAKQLKQKQIEKEAKNNG